MIELDIEYKNGERETLKVEDYEEIIMTRSGRIVAIRHDGVTCEGEKKGVR